MSWAPLRPLSCHCRIALVPNVPRLHYGARATPNKGKSLRIFSPHGYARRTISTATVYTVLTPPVVFAGLVLSLWVYKCCMMILFQNKIIYMPSMPPFSRSEKIADYARRCLPITWREGKLRAADGVELSLCVADSASNNPPAVSGTHVVVLYFQGNGSSLPPRLPYLSDVLKQLTIPPPWEMPSSASAVTYTIAALSYRGFWTSRGRPSQQGIERDAEGFLSWAVDRYSSKGEHVKIVLWGQSIGAGVATTAASRHLGLGDRRTRGRGISGLILETPFTSVRDMLVAVYPQTWMPYRYLWPFLWNRWDSREALREMARSKEGKSIKVLIVQAGKDELVPMEHGLGLEDICRGNSVEVQRTEVAGALHTDVMTKAQGRNAVVGFLQEIGRS